MTEEEGKSSRSEGFSSSEAREKAEQYYFHVADRIERIAARKDRLLVTLAGGALVLSITFLRQVAPDPEQWTLWLLTSSWIVLVVALGLSLFGHFSSQKAHERQQWNLFLRFMGKDVDELENPWDRRTTAADLGAVISVGLGILLLTVFAAFNLPWEGENERASEARPAAERVTGEEAPEGGGPGGAGGPNGPASSSDPSAPAGARGGT